jgi:hypothetical protein
LTTATAGEETDAVPIDWNAVTGIGTVAVALSAVGIAVLSDWRSGVRLRTERKYSEKQLAKEREYSEKQLAKELARSDDKISEERRRAQEREQFAEASQVEVVLTFPRGALGSGDAESEQAPKLKLIVRNHGNYAITKIRAWAGLSLPTEYEMYRFSQPRQEQRSDAFNPNSQYIDPVPGAHPDWLPPWDVRLVFERDLLDPLKGKKEVLAGYPVVLWTDRWGDAWEHKRGELRQVDSSDDLEFRAVEFRFLDPARD